MVEITTPEVIKRIRDILGLRASVINQSQNAVFPTVIGNVLSRPVPIGFAHPDPAQNIVMVTGQYTSTAGPASNQFYTVTTNKVLYITHMSIELGGAANMRLSDGVADGGTEKVRFDAGARANVDKTFPTPLKFTSGIRADAAKHGASTTYNFNFVGWEEDA